MFVACVLAFRRGIVGELAARARVSLQKRQLLSRGRALSRQW